MCDHDRYGPGMTEDEIAAHGAEASDIVRTLASAQVGDANSAANLEALEVVERLGDDVQLTYSVVRIFSALTAHFAEVITGALDVEIDSEQGYDTTLGVIRDGLGHLNAAGHGLDDGSASRCRSRERPAGLNQRMRSGARR